MPTTHLPTVHDPTYNKWFQQADFYACNDLFVAGFKYNEYLLLSYAL